MKSISTNYGVRLTRRENEISSMAAAGLSSELIAELLSISKYTVANHRKSILKKKGVSSIRALRAPM